jgi:ketosteroid isomerase-like protein
MSQISKIDDERAIAIQIETYRQGFLHLSPERIASIWDTHHAPLIYVAQEMREPTYGWDAIRRYFSALPDHLEKVLSKSLSDMRIDVLGDTAIAFFISHTTAKLKRHVALHEPTFRATMIFHRTAVGWRVIHYHESSLAALATQVMSSAS